MEKNKNREEMAALLRSLSSADRAWLRQRLMRRDSAALLQDTGRIMKRGAKSAPTIRFCALRLPPAARAANDSIKTLAKEQAEAYGHSLEREYRRNR